MKKILEANLRRIIDYLDRLKFREFPCLLLRNPVKNSTARVGGDFAST